MDNQHRFLSLSGTLRGRSLAIFTLLMLTGCLVKPEFQRPVVLHDPTYRDGRTDQVTVANVKWWDFFKDPNLSTLLHIALKQNRDLALAKWRIDEARAVLGIVRPDQFPRLDGGVSANRTQVSELVSPPGPLVNDYRLQGRLSFEVDLWGKFASATEAQRSELLASEESYKTVTLTLVAQVATTYLQLLDIDRQIRISERTLSNRRSYTKLIQERFAGGYTAKIDLNQAQIQEQDAAAALIALRRAQRLLENSLSVLLGHVPHAIRRSQPDTNPIALRDFPVGVPADLLMRRPDVRAAEEQARAAVMRIGVARATQFPALNLLGIIGLNSTQTSELFTADGRTWSVGGDLLGPIIDLGKSWSRTEAAEAQAEQALRRYEGVVLQAVREVEDSLVETRTFHEEHAVRQSQVVAAQSADTLARRRYNDGVTSYLEVLNTQTSLFSAELARSNMMQRYLSAIVQLYKALGGGWELPEEQSHPVP